MRHWPEEVRLIHGEQTAKQALAEALRARAVEKQRHMEIVIP
jgi:metallo-beta-lactamase family protein